MIEKEDILEDEPGIGDEATIIDDDVDEDIIENDIIDDDDDMHDMARIYARTLEKTFLSSRVQSPSVLMCTLT